MHVENLKKGDIILNARQTADLLNHGQTYGVGKAYAAGTTSNKGGGSLQGGAAGKTLGSSSSVAKSTQNIANSSKDTAKSAKDTAEATEDTKENIDWIDTVLSRIERKVKNLKSVADNIYISFKKRNKNLTSEIKTIRKEISTQEKAAKRYKKEAQSVGLSSSLKKLVQNGTIDIRKYDADTQKKIQEYQTWYEKMLDCKDAAAELKETLGEVYSQRFDNIITQWSNSLQGLEHKIEHAETVISNRTNEVSDRVTTDRQNSVSKLNITDYWSTIGNKVSLRDQTKKEIEELNKELAYATRDPEKTGITKGSEAYYEMLAQIQELEDKFDELDGEIIDGINSIADEYMNVFDNINTDFENKLSLSEHISNVYSNALDLAEEQGYMASTRYYEMLSNIEQQNITLMMQQLEALKKAYEEAMASGLIEVGSKDWYEMRQQINSVSESIDQATLKMEQFANSIRQIGWDRFDYLQDKISLLTDEANFLIDVMSNSELFDDKGIVNDKGMATFGLHGQNYNVLMHQADDYAEEIQKINAEIARDPSDTKLIARKEELIRLQQESIKSAEAEKQAIKSLVKEGIEKQLASLKDLIDKYKDALDSQKDLYDYQKKLAEQVKNINSLQKQLHVYDGDTSEETQAKVQKLKVELEKAKSDLEETQYDHFISDQKKLLDDLYDEYEKVLNERLDDIDALIRGVIDEVNKNSSEIRKTINTVANDVGYTVSAELQSIWDGSISGVLSTYYGGFEDSLTAVSQTLNSIEASVQKLADDADRKAAEAETKAEEEQQTVIVQQPEPTPDPTPASTPATQPEPTPAPVVTPSTSGVQGVIDKTESGANVAGAALDPKIMKIINKGKKHDKTISDYENKHHTDLWKHIVLNYGRDVDEAIMKELADYLGVKVSSNITNAQKTPVLTALKKAGYASGTPRVSKKGFYWTNENWKNGESETIIRKEDGAILTPLNVNDMVYKAAASKNLYDLAQDPKGYVSSLVPDMNFSRVIPPNCNNSTNITSGDTTLNLYLEFPNVQNYQEIKYAMQHDREFEGFIQSISVDRLAGKSRNSKFNYFK